jgi:hypothetical protein
MFNTYTIIMLGCGVFWTITYILIIRRSILDHTYGMPLVALCANISWECIFSFIYPPQLIQHIVNLVWFLFDTVLLAQALRYGPREFADLPKRVFYSLFSLTLATSFFVVLLMTTEFHDKGGIYTAFGSNLMMSVLFILMLYRRRSLRGQSMSIAICKLIGTALASLAFYLYSSLSHQSVLLPFLYVAIFVYDAIYVWAVYKQQRQDLSQPSSKTELIKDEQALVTITETARK